MHGGSLYRQGASCQCETARTPPLTVCPFSFYRLNPEMLPPVLSAACLKKRHSRDPIFPCRPGRKKRILHTCLPAPRPSRSHCPLTSHTQLSPSEAGHETVISTQRGIGPHRNSPPHPEYAVAISGIIRFIRILPGYHLYHLPSDVRTLPSLIIMTGARPHAPTQRHASRENFPSGVHSPPHNPQLFHQRIVDIPGAFYIARRPKANRNLDIFLSGLSVNWE